VCVCVCVPVPYTMYMVVNIIIPRFPVRIIGFHNNLFYFLCACGFFFFFFWGGGLKLYLVAKLPPDSANVTVKAKRASKIFLNRGLKIVIAALITYNISYNSYRYLNIIVLYGSIHNCKSYKL